MTSETKRVRIGNLSRALCADENQMSMLTRRQFKMCTIKMNILE